MRTALFALSALCGLALASATAQAQPAGVPGCTACHGPAGNSLVPSIPSIAGQPKVFLENQLVLIREGLRDVPSMKAVMRDIKDDEIVALANYFAAQTLDGKVAFEYAEEIFSRGLELASVLRGAVL